MLGSPRRVIDGGKVGGDDWSVGATVRVCLVCAVAVVAAGCGQAATGSRAASRGLVYHVSIALRDSGGAFGPSSERGIEWLDPTGQRFRVASAEQGHANRRHVPVTTLDVGEPGVDESTTTFPGDAGPFAGRQTTLSYGSPGPGGAVDGADFTGMSVLRAYLGDKVKGAPKFTVTHVGGRVRLTYAFPGLSAAAINSLGAPASIVKKLRRAAARGRIVMTILGTISRPDAQRRGLFAVDPAKADMIVRSLKPGIAPTAPTPSYWLGSNWDAKKADTAISTLSTHRSTEGEDSYDISYGEAGGAFGRDGALNVTTQPSPTGAAGSTVLFGRHGPFGGHGQKIRLEDGTPAYFYYQPFPPKITPAAPKSSSTQHVKILASATVTASSSTWSVGGGILTGSVTSTQPFTDPPFIIVLTRHAQIILSPTSMTTRAQALRIAEALRPV